MGIVYIVIGYIIGLLLAPMSGKENRNKIKDSVANMTNKIKNR